MGWDYFGGDDSPPSYPSDSAQGGGGRARPTQAPIDYSRWDYVEPEPYYPPLQAEGGADLGAPTYRNIVEPEQSIDDGWEYFGDYGGGQARPSSDEIAPERARVVVEPQVSAGANLGIPAYDWSQVGGSIETGINPERGRVVPGLEMGSALLNTTFRPWESIRYGAQGLSAIDMLLGGEARDLREGWEKSEKPSQQWYEPPLDLISKPAQMTKKFLNTLGSGGTTPTEEEKRGGFLGLPGQIPERTQVTPFMSPEWQKKYREGTQTYSNLGFGDYIKDFLTPPKSLLSGKVTSDNIRRPAREVGALREQAYQDLIQNYGLTPEEASRKVADPFSEFAGELIFDPLNLIPGAAMEKVLPVAKIFKGAGKVLERVPLVGKLFQQSGASKVAMFGDDMYDTLANAFKNVGLEDRAGAVEAVLGGNIDNLDWVPQRSRGILQDWASKLPKNANERLMKLFNVDNADDMARMINDDKIMDAVIESWTAQAVKNEAFKLGLKPSQEAGVVQKGMDWTTRAWKEQLLANPAYLTQNFIDNMTKGGILNGAWPWQADVAKEFGVILPRGVGETFTKGVFQSGLDEWVTGVYKSASSQVPIPLYGKPAGIRETGSKIFKTTAPLAGTKPKFLKDLPKPVQGFIDNANFASLVEFMRKGNNLNENVWRKALYNKLLGSYIYNVDKPKVAKVLAEELANGNVSQDVAQRVMQAFDSSKSYQDLRLNLAKFFGKEFPNVDITMKPSGVDVTDDLERFIRGELSKLNPTSPNASDDIKTIFQQANLVNDAKANTVEPVMKSAVKTFEDKVRETALKHNKVTAEALTKQGIAGDYFQKRADKWLEQRAAVLADTHKQNLAIHPNNPDKWKLIQQNWLKYDNKQDELANVFRRDLRTKYGKAIEENPLYQDITKLQNDYKAQRLAARKEYNNVIEQIINEPALKEALPDDVKGLEKLRLPNEEWTNATSNRLRFEFIKEKGYWAGGSVPSDVNLMGAKAPKPIKSWPDDVVKEYQEWLGKSLPQKTKKELFEEAAKNYDSVRNGLANKYDDDYLKLHPEPVSPEPIVSANVEKAAETGFADDAIKEAQKIAEQTRQGLDAWMNDILGKIGTVGVTANPDGATIRNIAPKILAAYREALDGASQKALQGVNDTFFNYAWTNNLEEHFLKKLFPFITWQTRNIPYYAGQIAKYPVLGADILKYYNATDLDVEQRKLPAKYRGTVPIPQPIADFMVKAGWLNPGVNQVNPLLVFVSVMSQFRPPYIDKQDTEMVNNNETLTAAQQALKWAQTIGMNFYPWFAEGFRTFGLYGNDRPWDLMRFSPMVKVLSGGRIDPEYPWKEMQRSLQEQVTGKPVDYDPFQTDAAKRILVAKVERGEITNAQLKQAMVDKNDPIWKEAMQEALRRSGMSGTVRAMQPFNVKNTSPEELKIRQDRAAAQAQGLDSKAEIIDFYNQPGQQAWSDIWQDPEKIKSEQRSNEYYTKKDQLQAERDKYDKYSPEWTTANDRLQGLFQEYQDVITMKIGTSNMVNGQPIYKGSSISGMNKEELENFEYDRLKSIAYEIYNQMPPGPKLEGSQGLFRESHPNWLTDKRFDPTKMTTEELRQFATDNGYQLPLQETEGVSYIPTINKPDVAEYEQASKESAERFKLAEKFPVGAEAEKKYFALTTPEIDAEEDYYYSFPTGKRPKPSSQLQKKWEDVREFKKTDEYKELQKYWKAKEAYDISHPVYSKYYKDKTQEELLSESIEKETTPSTATKATFTTGTKSTSGGTTTKQVSVGANGPTSTTKTAPKLTAEQTAALKKVKNDFSSFYGGMSTQEKQIAKQSELVQRMIDRDTTLTAQEIAQATSDLKIAKQYSTKTYGSKDVKASFKTTWAAMSTYQKSFIENDPLINKIQNGEDITLEEWAEAWNMAKQVRAQVPKTAPKKPSSGGGGGGSVPKPRALTFKSATILPPIQFTKMRTQSKVGNYPGSVNYNKSNVTYSNQSKTKKVSY